MSGQESSEDEHSSSNSLPEIKLIIYCLKYYKYNLKKNKNILIV